MRETAVIRDIGVFRFDIPLKNPLRIATMSVQSAENVLVRLETGDGVVGWGEASPYRAITGETREIALAAAGALKTLLLGRNPLETGALSALMERHLPRNTAMRSAFDMALFDVAARYASLPLFRFLGGARRALDTDVTIYLGNPAEAVAQAEAIVRAGFRAIKIKLGRDCTEDLAKVAAVRRAVGGSVRLRVDANQAWDRMTALRMLRAIEEYEIEFCEQPCPAADHAALKYLAGRSRIPIMADESLFSPEDALALDRGDVVPYFNIKLSKSGGIGAALKIAAIAEAGGRRCMLGCMCESRLGLTAAAHVALAAPAVSFFDLDTFWEHRVDPVRGGMTIRDGTIEVSEEPGIGAVPDESRLGDAVG
jgi:L-alanine-DL-glutamate epimerase-like enolase superfamily enzyme